jgi:hypothetical protein
VAYAESEVLLSVCAVAERDGRDAGAATLAITAIDGEITPAYRPAEQATEELR